MSKIPEMDSVAELARFWDSHEVTGFEDELEEVTEPVFDRSAGKVVRVSLEPEQAAVLHRIARDKGLEDAELIEEWINEKLRVS